MFCFFLNVFSFLSFFFFSWSNSPLRISHYIQLSYLSIYSKFTKIFWDLDSFVVYLLGILCTLPVVGFIWCFFFFFHDQIVLWGFEKKKIKCHSHYIMSRVQTVITVDFNFDQLVSGSMIAFCQISRLQSCSLSPFLYFTV